MTTKHENPLLDPPPTTPISITPDADDDKRMIVRYPGATVTVAKRDLQAFLAADEAYAREWFRTRRRAARSAMPGNAGI